jgi:hypothetical protein
MRRIGQPSPHRSMTEGRVIFKALASHPCHFRGPTAKQSIYLRFAGEASFTLIREPGDLE